MSKAVVYYFAVHLFSLRESMAYYSRQTDAGWISPLRLTIGGAAPLPMILELHRCGGWLLPDWPHVTYLAPLQRKE